MGVLEHNNLALKNMVKRAIRHYRKKMDTMMTKDETKILSAVRFKELADGAQTRCSDRFTAALPTMSEEMWTKTMKKFIAKMRDARAEYENCNTEALKTIRKKRKRAELDARCDEEMKARIESTRDGAASTQGSCDPRNLQKTSGCQEGADVKIPARLLRLNDGVSHWGKVHSTSIHLPHRLIKGEPVEAKECDGGPSFEGKIYRRVRADDDYCWVRFDNEDDVKEQVQKVPRSNVRVRGTTWTVKFDDDNVPDKTFTTRDLEENKFIHRRLTNQDIINRFSREELRVSAP